ncbi:RND transporter [Geomonas limicola]|uniref:RND transporter n=1 Tax=Geomonas limicola TaxID=2740186 RepID=A0A6V8N1Z3_9BACT|nr:HlyD family secretion protein [Geomonas limicola]GFO66518.1 RND transporter [Geomonas limicola]
MDEEPRKDAAQASPERAGIGADEPRPLPGERRKEPRLEKDAGEGEEASRHEEEQPKKGKWDGSKSRLKRTFGSRKVQVALGLTVLAVALLFWWYSSLWESTDDAQIDGHVNQVSARVTGQVIKVRFEDNQFVRAGSVLVEIDPTDYQVALARARAELAEATAAAEGARIGVPITSVDTSNQVATARARVANARAGIVAAGRQHAAARARVDEARAQNQKYQSDLRRYAPLAARDIISQQQYDQARAAAASAAASVAAADATMRAAAQQVTQARGQLAQAEAELRTAQTAPQQVRVARSRSASAEAALERARTALRQAELNLQYTKVAAPVDGITGRKSVEPGQNVMPGQNLLFLVPVQDIWVTANFKEDQLRQIRPGQRVRISVDAYDRSYDGYVETIGAASGARFSLFPPENATGNYVKVVQRIPVRIRFNRGQDPEHLLRPGMSVVPKVRVQ